MARKRVFISFDYHNDKHYRYLLTALKENTRSPIDFDDTTPDEIDTDSVDRIKAVLTTKIRNSTHTLVIVGAHANDRHKDSAKIGTRNWQWWEIEKSKDEGKGLIAVKIEKSNESPEPLLNAGATWAMSFTVEGILDAINKA
jgi:hypothetical protein